MVGESYVVTGKVAASSSTGVKLEGEQDWRNASKFVAGLTMPQRGQLVALTLNSKNYITAVEVMPATAPTNGHGQQPPVKASAIAEASTVGTAPDRERCISRMAAINSAVAILSSGGRPTTAADVLTLAGELESWVYRSLGEGMA